MKSFVHRLKNRVVKFLRSMVTARYRSKLKNHGFTIIANNCIGGIIYHDLHERFCSPTINLDICPKDFVVLCEHLPYYLSLPIKEIPSDTNCPVGVILGEYGSVRINFRHYKTFEEGLEKWNERKKRIDWDNLFVIMEAQSVDEAIFRRFEFIPFQNKVLYASFKGDFVAEMPEAFYTVGSYWGKILDYAQNGAHRYLERLDYVHFLNGKGIRLRKIRF